MKMLRRIAGKTLLDRERNENIRIICGVLGTEQKNSGHKARDKPPLSCRSI